MFKIPVRDQIWEINKPQIMGILNATKDSFYEGSRVQAIDLAIEKAGIEIEPVDISDLFAVEVDFQADLDRANLNFN